MYARNQYHCCISPKEQRPSSLGNYINQFTPPISRSRSFQYPIIVRVSFLIRYTTSKKSSDINGIGKNRCDVIYSWTCVGYCEIYHLKKKPKTYWGTVWVMWFTSFIIKRSSFLSLSIIRLNNSRVNYRCLPVYITTFMCLVPYQITVWLPSHGKNVPDADSVHCIKRLKIKAL